MKVDLERIQRSALEELARVSDEGAIEDLRVRYLGRKGELTTIVRRLREVAPEDRPAIGTLINGIKDDLEGRIAEALEKARVANRADRVAAERVDVSIPGRRPRLARLHPLTQVMEELIDVFVSLGFVVAEGPEIEDDYHNFEALNFPADHPARDMQDTLFVGAAGTAAHGGKSGVGAAEFTSAATPIGAAGTAAHGGKSGTTLVMRTHTSPVQIRVMESERPPLRVIAPGAVYRHDSDVTHAPMFHQIEGFMVDRHVTFGDLKGVLAYALRRIFGHETGVRLRPSFFPFTEPSAELDIACFSCRSGERGCRICKGTGWVEILGAGMIDPNVFAAVGYDPEEFSGFAFGMGIERIAMLLHRIDDIRLFFTNDLRFLRQF